MLNSVLSRADFSFVCKRATKLVALILLSATLLSACTTEPAIEKPIVYISSCEPCHGNGNGGAPVTGDKEEWAIRLAKGREALYVLAIQGFESPIDDEGRTAVMPAKGGRPDLSDEEIKGLVDYMIAMSQ
jgi:cytochrome c5